ncbi:hypothetical protein [Nocardioides sp. J54]|uniref:hypothetical protein n=1 Tax=Nocardioides sp. J54 TaxID=935866 RepID=UPI0004B58EC8|nr:hypothetical protein [Nocardioides sp. J54]
MIRSIAATAVLATLGVVGAAAPASADDEVGLSRDGAAWTRQLDAPLFDSGFIWVPGDVEEASFLVRNDGPSDGELSVDVLADDPDGLLASDAFLLEARLGSGEWVEVVGGTTTLAPAVLDVPEGARTRVTVRGTFLPDTTEHQDELASLRVRVTLSESGDVGGVDDGDDGDDGDGDGSVGGQDGLPATGSSLDATWLWLAAGLVGSGIALVHPGRGRREVPREQA